ncbi:MAG: DUF6682 family protein [Phycisphaerales bacterium]
MATNAAIMADAAALLDDDANRRYPLRRLRRWLNDATLEVSRRSEALRTKTTLPTLADTAEVTLPTDVVRLAEVYWQGTGERVNHPLYYKDHRGARSVWGSHRDIRVGTPAMFWTAGYPPTLTLSLYPKPSRTGTAEVHYYRTSQPISLAGQNDQAEVDLPVGWQDLCVQWICMRARESTREVGEAERWKAEFGGKLSALISASERFIDEPGSMEIDDWYPTFDEVW